jgi:hypothetical protein
MQLRGRVRELQPDTLISESDLIECRNQSSTGENLSASTTRSRAAHLSPSRTFFESVTWGDSPEGPVLAWILH